MSPPLRIGFAMLAETGHHAGTFRLARSLRARGHDVCYLGLPTLAPLVEAQGFRYLPFADDRASEAEAGRGPLARRLAAERRFADFLARIEAGPLDACLRQLDPDVLLCDPFVWYVGLRAWRLRIPTINLSVVLTSHPNPTVPPIVSGLDPATAGPLRVYTEWARWRVRALFGKQLASLLLGRFRAPARLHHLHGVFRRIARGADYPCRVNDTYVRGEMGPRLVLPEIVLCPRVFELPGVDENRCYAGDFVDRDRIEPALVVPGTGPLILASLGTSPTTYPHAPRFFRAVAAASRLRPDWRFVLHTGGHPAHHTLGGDTANLVVREQVPQLALLAQAAAMITHGGINSLMECVEWGVPMLVVPGLRDQPGNAVRARRAGIALTATMSRIGPAEIVERVGRAMSDDGMRGRLAAMRQAIARENGLATAVDFIESRALGRARHAARERDR
jgi:zeaxanthin glucosyltransferase